VTRNRDQQENDTPNIAAVLKEEIVRLARKEIRIETNVLRRASAQYRRDIAELKRRVSDLQHKITPLEKQVLKNVPSQTAETDADHVRFTANGLRSQRKRLGLSAANYGKLHIGKREALARLQQLAKGNRKRTK
jgi:hypothetical protein